MARRNGTLEQRLWRSVDKTSDDGCWAWIGMTCRIGYGTIRSGNKMKKCHRVSYELACGPIPDGLKVLHKCDNRICVNPAHLFLGTQRDNIADMVAKGRHIRGHRASALHKGEANAAAKLKADDVRHIRDAVGTQDAIAVRYGVSRSLISMIRSRRIWDSVR
jgi:hypothetical protein